MVGNVIGLIAVGEKHGLPSQIADLQIIVGVRVAIVVVVHLLRELLARRNARLKV